MARLTETQATSLTILAAALGYFVDLFDMQLFSMLRVSSLQSLGLNPDQITTVGAQLLNWQMAGMLCGGILWGILGDKKGRVYVLFGTILLYSVGNLANSFVTTISEYAAARFFTGLGLAGEIGAGITLASELLPKATRGYGSTIIVGCGVIGPIVAGFMADALDWRTCYIGGGILGLLLLALRVSVNESGLFKSMKKENGGKFSLFFTDRKRFVRYICSIGVALPIWFTLGVIIIFAPEIGKAIGIATPLKASTSVMGYYIGITLGGFVSGLVSQIFKNRRKIMAVFVFGLAVVVAGILSSTGLTADMFYALTVVAGFFTGYWTLFLTSTAENFGTNLRTTATATAANFVRASLILNTALIAALKPTYGFITSVEIDGGLCFFLALLALWKLPETFSRDLNFIEK